MLLFAGPVWAQNKRAGVTYSGAEAARIVPGASYVKIKPVSPFPSFIRMSADSRQTPAGLLEQLKQVVKATPELTFVQVKQSDDELGMIHYQFEHAGYIRRISVIIRWRHL